MTQRRDDSVFREQGHQVTPPCLCVSKNFSLMEHEVDVPCDHSFRISQLHICINLAQTQFVHVRLKCQISGAEITGLCYNILSSSNQRRQILILHVLCGRYLEYFNF